MGVTIPLYTKTVFVNGGGPQVLSYNNAYASVRFENHILQQNPDGTYTIHGLYKIFQDRNQMFCIDRLPYNITVTSDKLTSPLHTIIFNYIKSLYPDCTDAN
jgi:hypothetical protein